MTPLALLGALASLAVLTFALWSVQRSKLIELHVLLLALSSHALLAFLLSFNERLQLLTGGARQFEMTRAQLVESGCIFFSSAIVLFVSIIVFHAGASNRALRNSYDLRAVLPAMSDRAQKLTAWALLSTAIFIWSFNFNSYLDRPTYFIFEAGSILGLLGYAMLPLGALASYVLVNGRGAAVRALAGLSLALALTAELSRASRGLPALLFALTVFLIVKHWRRPFLRFCLAVLGGYLVLLAWALVVDLRGLVTGQGLVPYAEFMLSGGVNLDQSLIQLVANNIVLSIPVTYYSAEATLPPGFLSISMSPLDGDVVGWYEIAPLLSLGFQTPSNAVGQIAALGALSAGVTWAAIALFALVLARVRLSLPARWIEAVLPLTTVLVGAGSIQFLQYSLRAGMRFFWLALFVVIVAWIFSRLAPRDQALLREVKIVP